MKRFWGWYCLLMSFLSAFAIITKNKSATSYVLGYSLVVGFIIFYEKCTEPRGETKKVIR